MQDEQTAVEERTTSDRRTIALVDDDRNILTTVSIALQAEGFATRVYSDGEAALKALNENPPDLAVLDIKMPRMDGMELLRRVRERSDLPVIFLTSKDEEGDEEADFEMGADDYIAKPFSLRLLIARIRALLRRPADPLPATLCVADLELDTGLRVARRGAREIPLTTKEFSVLELLMRNPGRVMTREQIGDHAWDANFDPFTNVIDVYIARLRRKVDAPAEPPLIETVRGAGYRLGPARQGRAA